MSIKIAISNSLAIKSVYLIDDEEIAEIEKYLPLQTLEKIAMERVKDGVIHCVFGTPLKVDQSKPNELRNYFIQGTGAEILYRGLIALAEIGLCPDIVVHDNFLMEQDDPRIKEALEFEIDGVKFPVECQTGKNWAEATE